AGDIKRASSLARRLALPIAFIDKQRLSDTEVTSRGLVGDVRGKTALVIDDEVSTAGTLVQAADSLMQNGAQAVYAAFTHGVYVGPAIDRIEKAPIAEVAATNTCTYKARPSSKIKQLSVGPLFAEAIWRIHRGESVSSLFT
ncbi:ribose-phosphate diphosphokinase, partial [Meiothermus cerbereus]